MNDQEIEKLIAKMQGVFATKEDLEKLATKGDIKAVKKLITTVRMDLVNVEQKIDDLQEDHNATREDVAEIRRGVTILTGDKLMKELSKSQKKTQN